jgi:phosphonatase-like hydrolase
VKAAVVAFQALRISRRQSLKGLAAGAAVPYSALAARNRPVSGIRLVVLDVGGTIIEDRSDLPQVLSSALAHHGIESSAEEIRQRRGASKREIIRYFVEKHAPSPGADRLIATIYDEFSSRLMEAYRTVPAIAGAENAFQQMRHDGYLLATTTGFDRAMTSSIFKRLGWEQYFVASICSDDVAQGRPAPFLIFHAMEAARVGNVAEVMTVGDTPLDLQAGTNAGVRAVVGVLSGASNAETLRREPHTHILQSVASLPALLKS